MSTNTGGITRQVITRSVASDPSQAAALQMFFTAEERRLLETRSIGRFEVDGEDDGVLYGRTGAEDVVGRMQRGPLMTAGSMYALRAEGEIDKNGYWPGGDVSPTDQTDDGRTRLQIAITKDGEILETMDYEPGEDGVMRFQNHVDGAELGFFFLDGGLDNNYGEFTVEAEETQVRAVGTEVTVVSPDAEGAMLASRAAVEALAEVPGAATIPEPDLELFAPSADRTPAIDAETLGCDLGVVLDDYEPEAGVVRLGGLPYYVDPSLRPSFGTPDFERMLRTEIEDQYNLISSLFLSGDTSTALADLMADYMLGRSRAYTAYGDTLPSSAASRDPEMARQIAEQLLLSRMFGELPQQFPSYGGGMEALAMLMQLIPALSSMNGSYHGQLDSARQFIPRVDGHNRGAGADLLVERVLRESERRRKPLETLTRADIARARFQNDPAAALFARQLARKDTEIEGTNAEDLGARHAVAAHEALTGALDTEGLIELLANRSNEEIRHLKSAYRETNDENLTDAIEKRTYGSVRTTLVDMVAGTRDESTRLDRNLVAQDVATLHEAMDGIGITHETVSRIFSTRSGAHLRAVDAAYAREHETSLREAIMWETSGFTERALLAQLDRRDGERATTIIEPRDDRDRPTGEARQEATEAAKQIKEAFEDTWGTDNESLIGLMSNRTNAEMTEIRRAYEVMYDEDFIERLTRETDGWSEGNYQELLLALARGERLEGRGVDPARIRRDAEALHQAITSSHDGNADLIRILSQRTPAQLQAIAQYYPRAYDGTLRGEIRDQTSGDYERLLLAVLDGSS